MNAISSLSARQLRRAAEIKEEIHSLENELNRIADSPGIHLFPGHRGRVRMALRAGIVAAASSRWTRAGARSLVLPAQRLKRQVSGAARAKFAAAARSRLDRIRNIEIG